MWEDNLKDELAHWEWAVRDRIEDMDFRLDPNTEIQDYIKPYITIDSKILDIGCGPVTSLGKYYDGHKLDIKAVDILADQYNELLREHGLKPPVKTIQGSYETVKGEYDLIHTRNSLDHCQNPILAIDNLLKACKGFLFIQVYENEANRCNWQGLHQWNFSIQDDKLHLSNKTFEFLIPCHLVKLEKNLVNDLTVITAVIRDL